MLETVYMSPPEPLDCKAGESLPAWPLELWAKPLEDFARLSLSFLPPYKTSRGWAGSEAVSSPSSRLGALLFRFSSAMRSFGGTPLVMPAVHVCCGEAVSGNPPLPRQRSNKTQDWSYFKTGEEVAKYCCCCRRLISWLVGFGRARFGELFVFKCSLQIPFVKSRQGCKRSERWQRMNDMRKS